MIKVRTKSIEADSFTTAKWQSSFVKVTIKAKLFKFQKIQLIGNDHDVYGVHSTKDYAALVA